MTTPLVQSISDEQLADSERLIADLEQFVCIGSIAALISRLRAAEADAKRYRWLRDKTSMPCVVCTNPQIDKYFNEYMMCGDVMDKAIDAAMEQKA